MKEILHDILHDVSLGFRKPSISEINTLGKYIGEALSLLLSITFFIFL